ncbi:MULTISPECIES: TrbC/VirB2 family protein [Wolbachia]|uniref:TrbC/VirB2 family protein n=1 Tax=Wolbachia TaxID=953 RepID=UPI0020211348|nr:MULTISPECIES: TrbC/VirB2 family protein [unclassified Wolbachia]URG40319.1 TrbC/VirB2 family protein [Wolbachia endosymbiont of Ostrinia furnacalis]URG41342.1 TrbC/VirB2 family protein [Wolbachia endosymbiont of Ostrinia scapulalis]
MSYIIKKLFNALCIVLFLSFSDYANAADNIDDTTAQVICNIIGYIWGIGGPLMTVVIIGAALLAIFGRMPWPALFALGMFCGVFFGAKTIIMKIIPNISTEVKDMLDKCGK